MVCFSTAHQKTKSTSSSKTRQKPPSLDHVNEHDNVCDLIPSIRPYLHYNLMRLQVTFVATLVHVDSQYHKKIKLH